MSGTRTSADAPTREEPLTEGNLASSSTSVSLLNGHHRLAAWRELVAEAATRAAPTREEPLTEGNLASSSTSVSLLNGHHRRLAAWRELDRLAWPELVAEGNLVLITDYSADQIDCQLPHGAQQRE